MTRWHVNPGSGRVGRCKARVSACPFGDQAHFSSEADAYEGAVQLCPDLRELSQDAMKSHRRHREALEDHAEAVDEHREADEESRTPHQLRMMEIALDLEGKTVGDRPSPFHLLKTISAGRPAIMGAAMVVAGAGAAVKYFSPEAERSWRRLEQVRALSRARKHADRYEDRARVLRAMTGVSPEAQAQAHFDGDEPNG